MQMKTWRLDAVPFKHPSALRLQQHRNYTAGGFLCFEYVNLFVTQISVTLNIVTRLKRDC